MAKKKTMLGSLKKMTKDMKYWYVKDENGQINNTARILFHGLLAGPIVAFEGIKVGFYSRMVQTKGFITLLNGLSTPAFKVYQLRHQTPNTGFGNQYAGFDGAYLGLFILFYATVFAALYMAAERNKNKSHSKDGDMKFGKISEFNAKMAYCNSAGEPIEPPENSYEPGNMILAKGVYYSLEPKGTNTYSCAMIVGATGCVDKDTEYFNGSEWKKISEYTDGEQVLQFDTETNEASLVKPLAYIKEPCNKMYHFETKYGINQTLSPEHRVIYYTRKQPTVPKMISAEELKEKQNNGKFHGRFKTDFCFNGDGINLTDTEIKLMLAVIADGSFQKGAPNSLKCRVNLKKQRKIDELHKILTEYNKPFEVTHSSNGYSVFSFNAPAREKEFLPYWYNCSKEQLELICDNVLKWDGSIDNNGRKIFSTSIKKNADFIQFAFSACSYRATILENNRVNQKYVTNEKLYKRKSVEYRVCISQKTLIGMDWVNDGRDNVKLTEIKPDDGYKYCFRVPTSALVLRKNGRIFITGNCGKSYTYVKPNILQMNSSYVVTDPKGELTTDLGAALMRHGYKVKVFNVNELQYSCRYNPFKYIRGEADVVTAVNVFLENTKEKDAAGDAFFDLAEKNFYLMLFYYVYTVYKDEPEKQTFKTIYELYQLADEQEVALKRGEAPPETEFDKKFKQLAINDPTNPALPYYATFKKGSNKTKQSILISVGVKLWFMSVGEVANLMSGDDLELEKMGDRKTALFIIMPAEKNTYKFLTAMLFTQLFETLYYVGGTLNDKSYMVQKGNCVAIRSDPFMVGTKEETDALNKLKTEWELYQNAYIEDDEELIKTDPEIAKKFNTPNKFGMLPFPMARLVYNDKETGERRVLEEFQSRAAAEMVKDAIDNGEIVRGRKSLTNHVRFMMDEFFSIGKIEGFDQKIATFRSLRISCDIIVQSTSQLKEMYEDHEAKITNNCNIQILLGAASMDDCQYFSDMIGQTTVKSESVSINHKGIVQGADGTNLSENAQLLLRPEKIRTLNKDRCLILVNTQFPIWADKYKSEDHPRWYESYIAFSKEEMERTKNNKFQFERLFFIEQKGENRVRTILPSVNTQAALMGKAQDVSDVSKRNLIKGVNASSGDAPINATNKPSMKNAAMEYERRKRERERFIQSQQIKKPFSEQVADSFQSLANEYGEIPIANLKKIGIDNAAEILINAANAQGQKMWQTAEAKTPGAIRFEPTPENKKALISKGIKETQVVSNAADAFDTDSLWD